MIRSDSLDALNAALSAAQGEFEAVSKTANNPFFKSKYAALPDVVKAATPILTSHGLSVWQGADTDEGGEILWTVVLHSSGQYIGSAARLLPVKNDPQAQGSAVTYQRRYQYMAALGLVADEDDDGNRASGRTASKPASRDRKPAKAKTPPRSPEPASEPQDAPQGASHGSTSDSPGSVTDEQLANIAANFKAHGWSVPKAKKILREASYPEELTELSEDQASWFLIRLGKGPGNATA